MKLTYDDLVRKHSGLMDVGKLILPRKVAVAVSRNIVKMEDEIKVLNSQQKEIVDRYVLKNDNGEPVVKGTQYDFASDDDKKAFEEEMTDLRETEVDIDILMFDSSELDKCETEERYSIPTPIQEVYLIWMMNEEDNKNNG